MPIKGVSELRRLPRAGKIHLGVKEISKKTHNEFPRAVDYFVVHADGTTPSDSAEAFKRVYGERPKVLEIVFPCEDENVFFSQWYKRYGQAGKENPNGILMCKGDGEEATELDPKTGKLLEKKCNPEACEYYQKKHCRKVGNFQFFLPRVMIPGIWQIDTSSFNGIVNINSGIELLRWTCKRISGFPLFLRITTKSAAPDGKRKNIWVMEVRPMEPGEAVALFKGNNWIASMRRMSEHGIAALPEAGDAVPTDLYPESSRQIPFERQADVAKAAETLQVDKPIPPQSEAKGLAKPATTSLKGNGNAAANGTKTHWRERVEELYKVLGKGVQEIKRLEHNHGDDEYGLYLELWKEWQKKESAGEKANAGTVLQ